MISMIITPSPCKPRRFRVLCHHEFPLVNAARLWRIGQSVKIIL